MDKLSFIFSTLSSVYESTFLHIIIILRPSLIYNLILIILHNILTMATNPFENISIFQQYSS